MFLELWDMRLAKAEEHAKSYQAQAKAAQKQIEKLLDRIVEAEAASVISAYEKRIAKREREKILLDEKVAATIKPRYAQEELFELAFGFLSSPYKIYKNGSLMVKKTVLRLTFQEPISYSRKRVFETRS